MSINSAKNFNVYTFYYLFDRLGNIRYYKGMPKDICTHTNGGLFTEVNKTQLLDIKRFCVQFNPSAYECVPRETDEFYLASIGFKHPQWMLVHQTWLLAEKYSLDHNIKFDFMVRARPDNYPGDPDYLNKAASDFNKLNDNEILVMREYSFGVYSLSDKIAFGRPDAIKKYCEIGKNKNYIEIEQTTLWKTKIKQPYTDLGGSHESHIGAWLELNGIKFHRRDYLNMH